MQERRNSTANALELHFSYTNPSICTCRNYKILDTIVEDLLGLYWAVNWWESHQPVNWQASEALRSLEHVEVDHVMVIPVTWIRNDQQKLSTSEQGHTNLHNLCCLWIEMKHEMHFVGNKTDKRVQNFIAHDLEANDIILVIHKYRRSSESMWPQHTWQYRSI